MATIEEAIRRLKFLYETHGADQVAAAQAAITASTTATERAALSLEKSFNSLERKYVSTVRHQQDYAKESARANNALAQGVVTQERYDVVMRNMQQHYESAAHGVNTYGRAIDQSTQQGRLARHELINLSRQIQDVGVGIVSGQSPFTILVQQGAQMADVFATSTGTLAGFFRQVGAGAARFATSTAGITTGVVGIGASLGYLVASFASGQRDIERSLSGIGQASGVTRDQINQIAQVSSSSFGQSVSEAREAASAFAKTGKVWGENLGQATRLTDDFVRAGHSQADAIKTIGQLFANPVKGAIDLNKQYGFLTVSMLDNIRALQAQGKLQDAAAVAMEGLQPKIQEQGKLAGWLTKEWNAFFNFFSNKLGNLSRGAARDWERITGQEAGGFSLEERMARAQKELARVQPIAGQAIPLVSQAQVRAAREEVERLQKAMDAAAKAPLAEQLRILGNQADAIVAKFLPVRAVIEALQADLAKLQEYEEKTGDTTRYAGPKAVGTVRMKELQEQEAATVRLAQRTQEIAALYPGMSIETAKQLSDLQGQLSVVQARTPAEAIVAQELATQVQLLNQTKSLEEAMALAAGQRAIAEAQRTATIQAAALASSQAMQFSNAQLQMELGLLNQSGIAANRIKAEWAALAPIRQAALAAGKSEAEINAILAEQKGLLAGLIEANAQLLTAREQQAEVEKEIAAAQEAAAKKEIQRKQELADFAAQMNQRMQSDLQATNDMETSIHNSIMAQIREEDAAKAAASARQRARIAAEAAAWDAVGDAIDRTIRKNEGWGFGQHERDRIEGIILQRVPGSIELVKAMEKYGPGGFETEKIEGTLNERFVRANQQGIEYLINQTLGRGGSIEEAIAQAIAEGAPGQQVAQQLLDLLPEAQQKTAIQKMIDQVANEPRTLAREIMLKQLNDSLKGLTNSVDALNGTLSPFYSQDPRTTKLGFRAGVMGNADWLTGATNQTALDTILGKGATAPGGITITAPGGVTVTGPGGTTPIIGTGPNPQWGHPGVTGLPFTSPTTAPYLGATAAAPAPTVVHNDNRIIIQGAVDQDTLGKLKVSRYQQTQRMRSTISAA